MKTALLSLLLSIGLTSFGQSPLDGFTPFKLVICGETFYSATPEMIGVMKSHVGDYIPPLDMSGDGWIGAIDVVMLLSYQQEVVWFPNPDCINTSVYPFTHNSACSGYMPEIVSCHPGNGYAPQQFTWIDYGLIGELTTVQYGLGGNFTFYWAK
jgi:hypothetical protein